MLKENELYRDGWDIYRILKVKEDKVFVVNCCRFKVPFWMDESKLSTYDKISEDDLLKFKSIKMPLLENLSISERKEVVNKYSSISLILPVKGTAYLSMKNYLPYF